MEELIETGLFSPLWEHLSLFTHTYDICHAIIHNARFLCSKGTICLSFYHTISSNSFKALIYVDIYRFVLMRPISNHCRICHACTNCFWGLNKRTKYGKTYKLKVLNNKTFFLFICSFRDLLHCHIQYIYLQIFSDQHIVILFSNSCFLVLDFVKISLSYRRMFVILLSPSNI